MAIAKFPWKADLLSGGTVEVNDLGDWNFDFIIRNKKGSEERFVWKPSTEEVRDLTVQKVGYSKASHTAIQFFWSIYND